MLSSLRPLRARSFALLWGAALVSNVGGWMQTVAVGVLVTTRTGHAGWTGLVAAAGFLPIGLLAPVGGAMADRVDRRRWLFATTLGETAFAVGLTVAVATGHPQPALVTLLVFGGGCMQAVGMPAYQAMLPDLVAPADLGAAISLSSAQFNLGRVVGPALAGIAIVAGGYQVAFALNAASFVAVLAALVALRLPARTVTPDRSSSLGRRLATGASATWALRPARAAVALIGVVALTASPFIALVPAMAVEGLRGGAGGTSLLVTAQGVGAVTGALWLTPLAARLGRRRLLAIDLAAVGVLLVAYGEAPSLPLAAAALALVGASYIGVLSGANTVVQLAAPPAMRGRILSIYMMALGLCYPLGALAQGQLADVVGVRTTTAAGGVTLLVVVGLGRRALVPSAPGAAPGAGPEAPLEAPVDGAVPALGEELPST